MAGIRLYLFIILMLYYTKYNSLYKAVFYENDVRL